MGVESRSRLLRRICYNLYTKHIISLLLVHSCIITGKANTRNTHDPISPSNIQLTDRSYNSNLAHGEHVQQHIVASPSADTSENRQPRLFRIRSPSSDPSTNPSFTASQKRRPDNYPGDFAALFLNHLRRHWWERHLLGLWQ